MKVTSNDIQNAYKFILGRAPETCIDLVKASQNYDDCNSLRQEILTSDEARGVMWDVLASNANSYWFKYTTFFNRSIYLCSTDSAVSKQIFLTGEWEPDVANGLCKFFAPDMCFVDIGANIGWFTLLAADYISRQNGNGVVYSVEANASIVPYLAASVVDSCLARYVKILPYAASDSLKLVSISSSIHGNIGGFGITSADNTSELTENKQIVPAMPLDAIFGNFSRIDLIKLDIEGAEPHAIKGLSKTLQRLRPAVFIEINPSALTSCASQSPEYLYQQMCDLGYECYDFRALDKITRVGIDEILRRTAEKGYYDYLFLPVN
jgi:FkbM family methyltransferase